MNQPYTAAKFVFLSLLLSVNFLLLPAQKHQYLNSNNVKAGISIGSSLFTDPDSTSIAHMFESPKGSGVDPIFTQALWLTAKDANDTLYCAVNGYGTGYDLFDGPIATTYDNIYDHYYKRVWKVTQAQIQIFKTLSLVNLNSLFSVLVFVVYINAMYG